MTEHPNNPGDSFAFQTWLNPTFPSCVDRPFGFRNVTMPRFLPDKCLWGGFLCILIALAYAIARVMLEK
jgi:hypothetical protein